MKTAVSSLPAYKENTYEDPDLQRQYICLGHKIAVLRHAMNISQQQFARHIGISRSYVSKLECGVGISGASLEVLFKIAQSLHMDVSQLLKLRMQDYKACNDHLIKQYRRSSLLHPPH